MSGRIAEAVGWALVHSLWQFTLLGAALAVALRVLRGAPSTHRYALACATLALMLATSVATGVVALRGGEGAGAAASESASADAHPVAVEAREEGSGGAAMEPTDVAPRWFGAGDAADVTTRMRAALDANLGWIVAAWLVGVALLSFRLAGAWLLVQRMTRAGTSAPPRALADAARRLADALGVRRTVAVLASTLVHVPTVIGWLRPVILVPVSALTGLTPRQLELLVLHELAHIRRHDYLVNLLQTVCETLLFHHPAVWYVGRQIRAEREHCCDELAVGLAGVREYAGALATLEALRQGAPALAVTANGGSLLARVRRLVQPAPRPAPPRLGAAVLALVLALAVAAPAVGRAVTADDPALPDVAWTPSCPGASAAAGSTLCPDLESALGAMLAGQAPGASAIVQDVRTGAVLAYAATGDGARGLTEPVLPASVWKLVLSALWWEQGMGDGALPCPATLDVGGGRVMRNSTRSPATLAGPAEMLVQSCNTAAAAMALRLRDAMGEQGVLDGVRRMGFGAAEGVEGRDTAFWATRSADFRARMSPARGHVGLGDAWDGFAIGMLDVRTTPLHVARFLQAIGNDGMMVMPTVDAALAGRDAGHPVMSAATARRLREAMRDVVRRGTGTAAAQALGDAPWTLGGKTGTSPGGAAGQTDGWFAGLAFDRAGSARYVVVVRLPGGGPGGGAPARIAGRITRLLPVDVAPATPASRE